MRPWHERAFDAAALAVMWGVSAALPAGAQTTRSWAVRYDGPAGGYDFAQALAVDRSGNAYVAGYCAGGASDEDMVLLKYDRGGALLWERRYNGPANSWDECLAMVLDADGNPLLVGVSNAPGSTFGDHVTLKYDGDGNLLWARHYDEAHQTDLGYDVAVDTAGNVYSAGSSSDGATHGYKLIKYDADGNELWTRRYDGAGGGNDLATAVEVDADGNVVVSGQSCGSGGYPCGGNYDIVTLQYSPDGELLWEQRYNGPGDGDEQVYQTLAVDRDANAIVAGSSHGVGTDYDYVVLKYDSTGNLLWERRYDGDAGDADMAWNVAIDPLGNVAVTGVSNTFYPASSDAVTLKYDAQGGLLWEQHYSARGYDETVGYGLACEADGSVLVSGQTWNGWAFGADAFVVKYDPAGQTVWEDHYDHFGGGTDVSFNVAVGRHGDTFVGGISLNPGTGMDIVLLKYATRRVRALGE